MFSFKQTNHVSVIESISCLIALCTGVAKTKRLTSVFAFPFAAGTLRLLEVFESVVWVIDDDSLIGASLTVASLYGATVVFDGLTIYAFSLVSS